MGGKDFSFPLVLLWYLDQKSFDHMRVVDAAWYMLLA